MSTKVSQIKAFKDGAWQDITKVHDGDSYKNFRGVYSGGVWYELSTSDYSLVVEKKEDSNSAIGISLWRATYLNLSSSINIGKVELFNCYLNETKSSANITIEIQGSTGGSGGNPNGTVYASKTQDVSDWPVSPDTLSVEEILFNGESLSSGDYWVVAYADVDYLRLDSCYESYETRESEDGGNTWNSDGIILGVSYGLYELI